MVSRLKRVGRDFELLLDQVKEDYGRKGLRLSDNQASNLIAREHIKIRRGGRDAKRFFEI